MSLRWKLFVSYLAVITLSLIVLVAATAIIAPISFSTHVIDMRQLMGNDNVLSVVDDEHLVEDLDKSFREALDGALWVAGVAATGAAALTSWYISRRIVQPIKKLVQASQYIVEGHYNERLSVQGGDELGELTRSFNHMAGALAETEAMRQRLIADVSHELKTPLASIKGYMEGLEDDVIEPTPEIFQLVHREADRLQKLVHSLQELSRAEANQLQLDIQPHNLIPLIESAALWLRPQFDDKNVSLEICQTQTSVKVFMDFDRVRQVLLNLLGNALQYTASDGRVTIDLQLAEKFITVSIIDSGVGLNAEQLKLIFQRFYRVDKSRSRIGGGSGIGLTIARHIVEAHGGRIWAESDGVGWGSRFYFTLPVV